MNRVISRLLPLAAVLLLPLLAQAQDTASAMRGRVLDETGNPLGGASVVVVDLRTGNDRSFQTNASGTFLATNLPVGGPYRVTVNGTQTVEVASIGLGDTYNLTINMGDAIEEIVAVGQMAQMVETAPGPSATFDFADMDSAVAFNRDIKDVYAIDPRLNLDGFQINCAGKHPRFNSITLDGVSHNDRFGLNTNGYSTATGMPFPYDAIEQVSVELAPFDTNYGGFSACNVNAVTKSGSNEWEGGVFYEFTSEKYAEDKVAGRTVTGRDEPYEETKQGFSFGGPIIKDKLFIFGAYEESEEPRNLTAGPAGFTGGTARPWLSQADFDRITDISNTIYSYDPGGTGGNGAQTTENYLVRLDWDINDEHNVALIYNYYDGLQNRNSDGYPDSDPGEFEFANHRYSKGSISETYTAILRSQWTDSFSTEFFYTDSRMDDSQVTDGPKDMGEHKIRIDGFTGTVYLGADDSRQANSLYTDTAFLKLTAEMLAGDHVISGGYEAEDLEVFNIFVPQSRGGEWDYRDNSVGNDPSCDLLTAQERFDGVNGCGASGIDYFELGRPYSVDYQSAGTTNNPLDAAANFSNVLHALYVQDEIYFPNQDLTLTAGLRYEWFTSSDTPNYNENLSNAIGIRNDAGVDGVSLLMPRVGFTWGFSDDLTLRGGIGLFSGGNPNVWLANAWSNDGIASVRDFNVYNSAVSIFDGTLPTIPGPRVGGAIPQEQFDYVAGISRTNGADSRTNLIDPNYEQPREWKLALGGTWQMPWWDVTADIDYMYTNLEKGALYVDVSQGIVGETLAGAPIYANIPGAGNDNLMLTNSKRSAKGQVFSVVFNKEFDWGMDLMLGYAWTDAEDTGSMTSFTGSSSFENVATNYINDPRAATSNYSVKSRVTLRASFAREFWDDNTTRFTLMGYYGSGQHGTYTMTSEDVLMDDFSDRNPLYVPNGPSDPNAFFTNAEDEAAFFDWAKNKGLKRGQFVGRNSIDSKVSSRIDLRVDQEIPLFMDDLKGRAFLKIYNFTNMLNSDWGRQNDARFDSASVVEVELDPSGAYEYTSFSPNGVNTLQTTDSVWEMRLGLEVNFR
jgi:outer membrane receptor for ferrienterochelin and colicin